MIKLTNVSFSFSNHPILDNVSLEIRPGEFVFVVGQTGSGKSTLLRLMYMDLVPTKGVVVVGKYHSHPALGSSTPPPVTRDRFPGLPPPG
jgi:cell division transport system ATP-binding protein